MRRFISLFYTSPHAISSQSYGRHVRKRLRGSKGVRTLGFRLTNHMTCKTPTGLPQGEKGPLAGPFIVGGTGLEPVTPSLSSRYAHSDGRCLSPIFPAQLAFPDAFKNEVLSRPSTFVRLLCAAQTITRATRSGPSSAATVSCHSCPWDRRRGSRSGPTSRTSV
jgi:hypothetical protein